MVSLTPPPASYYSLCESLARPPAPVHGQQIFETDTYRTLIWNAYKGAWLPPWNTAWGRLQAAQAVGTAFDTLTPTQVTFASAVEVWTGRCYRFTWQMQAKTGSADCLIASALQLDTGSGFATEVSKRNTFTLNSTTNDSETFVWTHDWTPASDGTVSARFTTARLTATASTTTPSLVWIGMDDVGMLSGAVHP